MRQARAKALKSVKDVTSVSKDDVKRMENLVRTILSVSCKLTSLQVNSLAEKHCAAIDQLVETKSAELLAAK